MGLLLAFNLPPGLPTRWRWFACYGDYRGQAGFRGLGYNPFNPALIGRIVLLISFPVAMTTRSSADSRPGRRG